MGGFVHDATCVFGGKNLEAELTFDFKKKIMNV